MTAPLFARLVDSLAGDSEVHAAEVISEATIIGIDFCQSEGIPLTQVQQIQLVKAALMAFDGYRLAALGTIEVTATLIGIPDEIGGTA